MPTQLTSFVSSIADGLGTLIIPLGVIGIILGVAMTMMGFHHGSNTIRTAIVATLFGAFAKLIATALQSAATAPAPTTHSEVVHLMATVLAGALS
jgi:hypothetical protein